MTKQIKDSLIYEGKEYYLNQEILEFFFDAFPEKKPKMDSYMTALWRGYVATYEIKEKELFIQDIDWFSPNPNFSPTDFLQENFPGNKFHWFSGLLRIDDFRGEYDDEDNENAIYELLEFNKGNFIKHWKLDHKEFVAFKDILFEDFKKTTDYEKVFGLWRGNNPDMKEEIIDGYIYDWIIRHVREL